MRPSHTRARATIVACRCEDAFSFDRYGSWVAVAELLLKRGFSERTAEAIMRSKWTRWAADATSHAYGRVPAKALGNYIELMGKERAAKLANVLLLETFPHDLLLAEGEIAPDSLHIGDVFRVEES